MNSVAERGFVRPSYAHRIETLHHRLSHLKLGACMTEEVTVTSEMPVFDINEDQQGISTGTSDFDMSAHIRNAANMAVELHGAARAAMHTHNNHLSRHSLARRSYTIELNTRTIVNKTAHAVSTVSARIVRRT